MKITNSVYRIRGIFNQYLIVDGKDLTLIDTGVASNAKNICKFIRSIGFQPEDIKNILITHADVDHFGAVNSLKKDTCAQVFASKIEADAMRNASSSRLIQPGRVAAILFSLLGNFMPKPEPTAVDQLLKDGDVLPVLGGLKVIQSNGHTPGHLSFYLQEENVLFAGDSIYNKNGRPAPNLSFLTENPSEAHKSYEKQMMLEPTVICCGHAFIDLRK